MDFRDDRSGHLYVGDTSTSCFGRSIWHKPIPECVLCGKSFPPGEALGRQYRIEKCFEPESSGESISRVGGTGGIQCPDCSLEFESVNEQQSHRITRH